MNPFAMGIDISRWQGAFDMQRAVNEGFNFVIIKGGGGDCGLYTDSRFKQNYKNAEALLLPKGVYWYSKALTVADARKEAEYFYNNILKGRKFELPVYMDVEEDAQMKLGKRLLTDIIKEWCSYIKNKGYLPGFYSSVYHIETYMNVEELLEYEQWVAQWSKNCTYKYPESMGMWQFGGETNKIRSNRVAGVVCDQNYMYKDYPEFVKEKGINGYTSSGPVAVKNEKKTIDEIAKEVISGKWGNGAIRKQKLTDAGYDYSAVQSRVNKIIRG